MTIKILNTERETKFQVNHNINGIQQIYVFSSIDDIAVHINEAVRIQMGTY